MKWAEYEASMIEDTSKSVSTYHSPRRTEERKSRSGSRYSESGAEGARIYNRESYMWHPGMANVTAPPHVRDENMTRSSFSHPSEKIIFPSDEEILAEIRHILSTTDLMTVTKKSVREQLTRLFGVDISPKKEFIHSCIDGILKGEL